MSSLLIPNELAKDLADIAAGTVIAREDRPLYPPLVAECRDRGIAGVKENRPTGDERRWVKQIELVLEGTDGKLYCAYYEQGLTEKQDVTPFEYDGPEVEFAEVAAVEKTHVEYEPVK